MITSSHMIYSWAVAKATDSKPNKARTLAFAAGGLVPDLPTYVFFFVNTFILGTNQQLMWDTLYFDSAWSPFITLSHSLLLWPLLLVLAIYTKQMLLRFLATSALLHVTFDFFVHHDDAYRHFWPLTEWKFYSPLSYYDPMYYGNWVSSIDSIVIIGLLLWLDSLYTNTKARVGIAMIIILYITSLVLSNFIF